MRALIKKLIHIWPWPLTRNEQYDRQTRAILRKVCTPDSVCIDVGAYRGDILREMILAAPQARHIAFEPIPHQYKILQYTFASRADIYPYALGDANKTMIFHHVVSNPTYSGLKQRQYKGEEQIEGISVEVRRLDEVVSPETRIRLIKIDVEGGEYDVLAGAADTIRRWHPYIVFEHGLGGSDAYDVTPGVMYDLLVRELGYSLCLMREFLHGKNTSGFSIGEFEQQYWKKINCYFIAIPPSAAG